MIPRAPDRRLFGGHATVWCESPGPVFWLGLQGPLRARYGAVRSEAVAWRGCRVVPRVAYRSLRELDVSSPRWPDSGGILGDSFAHLRFAYSRKPRIEQR